jgi:hypothetical protein
MDGLILPDGILTIFLKNIDGIFQQGPTNQTTMSKRFFVELVSTRLLVRQFSVVAFGSGELCVYIEPEVDPFTLIPEEG